MNRRYPEERRKETAQKAFRSAVEVALSKFFEDLEAPSEEKAIMGIDIEKAILETFSKMIERTITGVFTLLAAANPEDEEKGYRILEEARDASKV